MDWSVNFLAVLVAAIANMILGSLWFGPFFGKQWMALAGITKKKMTSAQKSGMWKYYAGEFITTLITIYVLALSLKYLVPTSVFSAITIGILVWLGFIAALNMSSIFWQGKNVKLYIIENGHRLISVLVSIIILYYM